MKSREDLKQYFESDMENVDFSEMKYLQVEEDTDKITFHKKTEFNFKKFLQTVFLSLFIAGLSFLFYELYISDGAYGKDMLVPLIVIALFIFVLFFMVINVLFNGFKLIVTREGMQLKKIPFNRKMKFNEKSSIRVWRKRKTDETARNSANIHYNFGYIKNSIGGGNMWLSRESENDYLIFIFIAKAIKKKFNIPHSIEKFVGF